MLRILVFIACAIVCVWSPGINQRLESAAAAASSDAPSARATRSHGGIKQRIAVDPESKTASEPISSTTSPLHSDLKHFWSKGEFSSKTAQRLAHSAHQSGAQGVDAFASAGTNGKYKNNIMRDLKQALDFPDGAPDVTWLEIPMKQARKVAHPFLMPHQFFKSYFAWAPDRWEKHMGGTASACLSFWESMRNAPFVQKHPRLHDLRNTIPLGVHADAGAFSKQDSLYAISFNSLLGQGTTKDKRFIFTVLRKSEMSADTLDYVLRIMAWSFNVLLDGVTPYADDMGRPLLGGGQLLAQGWKGALCQVRGDWSFYCECFYFPQWNSAHMM